MDRRRFLALSAATSSGIGLAGCIGGAEETEGGEPPGGNDDSGDGDTEREEPEPEGGDGRPYTHYDLDIHDERSVGHPFWVDGDGRI